MNEFYDWCIYKSVTEWCYVLWKSQTSDREVTASTATQALLCNNLRQIVNILVSLSPSSISWYRCSNWQGKGTLCKRYDLQIHSTAGSRSRKQRWALHLYVTSTLRWQCWQMGHFTLYSYKAQWLSLHTAYWLKACSCSNSMCITQLRDITVTNEIIG